MYFFGSRMMNQQLDPASKRPEKSQNRLRAVAALMVALSTALPAGFAQQPVTGEKAASDLPAAPAPIPTESLNLRQAQRDFTVPAADLHGNPLKIYKPIDVPKATFVNSVRLGDMLKDGKINLSLSDALALALENNYDIAIARYYLDIADTDIQRTKSGAAYRGVGATVLTNTLGGSSSTLASSGAPGGSSSGAATGASGVTLTTDGVGPTPESLDPILTSTISFDRKEGQQSSKIAPRSFTNTNTYNVGYQQNFLSGTTLNVTWDNSRVASNVYDTSYSPLYSASFNAQVTQHLLQGAGIWVNKRYMYEAQLNRKITDSTFRQQILYTVNQVENIYWTLVSNYEDVQAKKGALAQSTKLLEDNKKQLEFGTMAPLDVVNAQSTVASDTQALISSQNALSYQQMILKQAIARNLNDPALIAAEIVPTDRVNLDVIAEENQSADELTKIAFKNRPELEQAVLAIQKDTITLKGARKALLPTLDAYAYYAGSGSGGTRNTTCTYLGYSCAPSSSSSYGTALGDTFNNTNPDKGIGVNLSINLLNRTAQADQARSQLEYRQAELHLEQLYTQIHMQVINAQIALKNDRESVKSAVAARDYNKQSLEAEEKKLKLGASTTANVLAQARSLASAENTLLSALGSYAKDRAALYQMLALTLQRYGINLNDATTGQVKAAPVVPGLAASK